MDIVLLVLALALTGAAAGIWMWLRTRRIAAGLHRRNAGLERQVAERTAAGLANAQPRHSSHSLAAVANVVIGLVQECSAKRTRDRIALRTGENDPVPTHAGDAVLSGSAVVAGTGVVLAIVVAVRLSR